MKQTLTFLLIVLFSFSVIATDTYKPYDSMTLQELEAVDTKSLDKDEKKAFKKALKAAQKTEKARLKAEKARQKEVRKKLSAVSKVYEKTQSVNDEFVAEKQILGPQYFIETNGLSFAPVPKYSLISVIHTNGVHTLQLYMHTSSSISDFNTSFLDFAGISPEHYASRKGLWRDYYRANLSGGIERDVFTIKQYADPCSEIACYFNEDFYIQLTEEDLLHTLESKNELALRIMAKRGNPIIVRIPFSYIVGYSLKLSELQPQLTAIKGLAQKWQEYILSQ